MKYTAVIAAFLGAVQATPCTDSPVSGVICDNMLFATGMNGDEDLGEDITMKGNKFHFNQQRSLMQMQAAPLPEGPAPAAPFEADWEGYTQPDKTHTLDPKAAKRNTGFYAQMQ